MSKTVKHIVYSLGILIYIGIMISLACNFYLPLIVVPFVAWAWALIVLIGFIRDSKRFRADIASDANKEWSTDAEEYKVVWEEEPHDTEWKYETAAIIGFTGMWAIYMIIGFLAR
ncbi:MAG: hypothetical protein PHD67_07250 [Oscillospiraceae bacterium]|nr:hypothetical protein [Oscillospiraceae bacterium]